MSKKSLVIAIFVLVIGGGLIGYFISQREPKVEIESQCQFDEMIFYYLNECTWCQKVKREGTISKIKELGVKVRQVNTRFGPVRHQFQGVPTFVIDEKVYSGYRTFEELKELLNCPS